MQDASLFREGETCWRVARAARVGLVVDGADYFAALRRVLIAARRELLLIGWDFDFEIEMLPGESDADGMAPDGYPNALGPFLEALVDRAPALEVYMLKWNGAVLVAPGRILPTVALYAFGHRRIHFALDGHHPFGACHHQKIVVADDSLAFCGGIDTTENRWDTSGHVPGDPRRVRKDGTPSVPWHDATMALSGEAAAALGALSRERWERARGERLERPAGMVPLAWPEMLPVAARDVPVAVARTEPPYGGREMVDEIERLWLEAIAAARRWIYIESQYFSAETICDALERRLREPDGPEVVVVNPQAALGRLEDLAMHVRRGRVIEELRRADRGGRFRIYHPTDAAGDPIYVHAKILVVDDRLVKLGSSNIDDRSMGFDTECDVAFEGGEGTGAVIAAFRARLLGEHLGASPGAVARTLAETGSLVATVERLNPAAGRRLTPIVRMEEGRVGAFLADTRLLDPRYRPGQRTGAGRGLRPRHLALAAFGLGLAFLALRMARRGARR